MIVTVLLAGCRFGTDAVAVLVIKSLWHRTHMIGSNGLCTVNPSVFKRRLDHHETRCLAVVAPVNDVQGFLLAFTAPFPRQLTTISHLYEPLDQHGKAERQPLSGS